MGENYSSSSTKPKSLRRNYWLFLNSKISNFVLGASLFWNTASEKQGNSIPQGKKEDGEISKEDINISINAEQDASNTSIASSLRVVDMPSFVESIHLVEEGTNQNTPQ